jgi:hypothetical protein
MTPSKKVTARMTRSPGGGRKALSLEKRRVQLSCRIEDDNLLWSKREAKRRSLSLGRFIEKLIRNERERLTRNERKKSQ